MKTGQLNRRITLLEPQPSKDADGKVIQGWTNRGKVWANIQHRPGSEAFQQARMEARDPATIAVRATALSRRLSSLWRVETDDTIYEVMLDAEDGQGQAWLHDRGEVLSRRNYQDGRVLMKVRLTTDKAGQAQARFRTAMKLLGQKKKVSAD